VLTGPLVRVRARGARLEPSYIDPAKDALQQHTAELISLVDSAVQDRSTRGELEEALTESIGDSRDHKLLKGLAKLLLDRATFDVAADLAPPELRWELFTRAQRVGPLAAERGPFERPVAADVIAELAAERGVAPDALADALYADLPHEQRIMQCPLPTAEALLHRYNVALVQAALLKATQVTLRLQGATAPRMRQLFRHIKFHQLLHRATLSDDTLALVLDGPSSLFHQSTRYGMQLANFFPAVLLQDGPWSMTAQVAWGPSGRALTLEVDHKQGLRSHLTDRGAWVSREQQHFCERWDAQGTGWDRRDGQLPIHLGRGAVVFPDYSFHNQGRVAHLDIVGFWRRDYLERRVALLRDYAPGNLILAVSRRLRGCKEALADLPIEVIDFAEVLPPGKVLAAIERVAR